MTTLSERLSLPNHALLFDLEKLSHCFQRVPDRRKRRGRRYPLATLVLIEVLAKLVGQDSSRAMAHWARLRKKELSGLFQWLARAVAIWLRLGGSSRIRWSELSLLLRLEGTCL